MTNQNIIDLGPFPHCDQSVLHAPGECVYCDSCPMFQAVRQAWGIAYTGKEPKDGELPCPSDHRRGFNGASVWVGNIARKEK